MPPTPNPQPPPLPHSAVLPSRVGTAEAYYEPGGGKMGGGGYLLRKHARPVTPPQPLKVGVTVAPGDGGGGPSRL